jgi:hypothetical protein
VLIVGVILLILGYVLVIPILQTLGIIAVIIGAILFMLGAVGQPIGGRRYWW